jgi:hypothetical protein
MDAAGTPREGWMTVVPLAVLLFIATYVLGGPTHVLNLIIQWGSDVGTDVINWFKHL